jgi:hypothetical protein
MNLFAKTLVWIVLSSFVAMGAKAGEASSPRDVQSARLVICSSAEKAQNFASQNQDLQAVIANEDQATKTDANTPSSACLVAGIAYISGNKLERVKNKDGSYDVTEILIVGVATPYGMLSIEPSVVYTLLKVTEEQA